MGPWTPTFGERNPVPPKSLENHGKPACLAMTSESRGASAFSSHLQVGARAMGDQAQPYIAQGARHGFLLCKSSQIDCRASQTGDAGWALVRYRVSF